MQCPETRYANRLDIEVGEPAREIVGARKREDVAFDNGTRRVGFDADSRR